MRKPGLPASLLFASVVVLLGRATPAQDLTFCVNTPTVLQSTLYDWNQTIDASFGAPPTYALHFDGGANGLADDVHLDALAQLPGGRFLFSTESPFTAGSTTYQPADVVRYDGPSQYSMFLAAASLGIADDANVDALGIDPIGRTVVSFDAPVTVGSNTFMPNDVAVIDGGALLPLVSGAALGLPDDLNVTGYEIVPGGVQLFQFDVPVELGTESFLPSDVAAYGGGTWSAFFNDPDFPADSAGTDFALPCTGPAYNGQLRATKAGGPTEIHWTGGGSALFDLVRGDLGRLLATGGDFTQALDAIMPSSDVCMADDTGALNRMDTRPDPAPGQGYFYLLRAVAGCGAGGSYDAGGAQVGNRDAEIAASAGDCP